MLKLLTPNDVSKFLNISKLTLANARSSGTRINLPYTKIGGSIRYLQSDVEKFIEDNTFNHTGESRSANV